MAARGTLRLVAVPKGRAAGRGAVTAEGLGSGRRGEKGEAAVCPRRSGAARGLSLPSPRCHQTIEEAGKTCVGSKRSDWTLQAMPDPSCGLPPGGLNPRAFLSPHNPIVIIPPVMPVPMGSPGIAGT
ncbi:unnamed protein product, partial [Bubo scandiacus]